MTDPNSEAVLTEQHVIIIACVCGVIIISLLIILFCFIFRRRRMAAKAYQGGSQGDPPPYNTLSPNKKAQVYDNQGMDASDGPPSQISMGMLPPLYMHANCNRFTNDSYNGGLDGHPNTDSQGEGNVPHSPNKDKYGDRNTGGDIMMGNLDGGYNPGDLSTTGGKPKKVIYEVVV